MLPTPFDQLQEQQINRLFLSKGDIVFREGDKTRGIFFIVSGIVELRRYTLTGDKVVIHTAKTRETFAEASLFSNHYHCDAQAIMATEIIELKKEGLLYFFQHDITFATALTAQFASQIMTYRRKIELMAIRNATERVYCGFVEGLMKNEITSFAAEIGLSHEVVYRSLSNLVKQGRLHKISRGKYSLSKA
ncbi:MAG: CRP-like cAMP-binding protein [Kiritimatiellia bacterium]|jgi:CRP-like cAMP-binding protein